MAKARPTIRKPRKSDPDLLKASRKRLKPSLILPQAINEEPGTDGLLASTRRWEVGERLYRVYSEHRLSLIRHLVSHHGKSRDSAIHFAQKLLDRLVFIAFCEQRGLLPDQSHGTAGMTPPLSKVTNPRWRNFVEPFAGVDKKSESTVPKLGDNGGLFHHDQEVDDLQFTDDWTDGFQALTAHDFNDEMNVDVLGHIFEKSIGDLKRLRTANLFDDATGGKATTGGGMSQSAERKRSGIYYTPPDFTKFLLHQTLSVKIQERREALLAKHGLIADDLAAEHPSKPVVPFWRECWDDLRSIKVCDTACGSGAFLIAAYDVFEEEYVRVADQLRTHEGPESGSLVDSIQNHIVIDNLYGVDLSMQSVEITQLALWIRSARRGKTLADFSRNVVQGNSLIVEDFPDAFVWEERFTSVFSREERGFDCIVGNPPWERLKLQEREFFADSAPEIAGAVSAKTRRELVAGLETSNPELHAEYLSAKAAADGTLEYARHSGRYPLTGQGDINTYMLFTELARTLVAPRGRIGFLVPSGIATDHTSKAFFAALNQSGSLIGLYDFENRKRVFADVDGRFKFCMMFLNGNAIRNEKADFVFFAHRIDDLRDKERHIALTAGDLALLNPNTRTCPIFRNRRDAELTKAIYRRVPILIEESRKEGGNPWKIKFVTMFHQTNDAELFKDPAELTAMGLQLEGNRWVGGGRTFLPLYEAKMVQAYDHRAASVVLARGNWVRQGQTEASSLVQHQNPEFVAQPRWWVDGNEVARSLKFEPFPWYIGFKDITSPTNERTMIAAAIPRSGVTNHFPLLLTELDARKQCCLLANLNSFLLDYVTRQKIGGITLNFFIVNQLPIFPPDFYASVCPWDRRLTLERWISDRVLKLTCTANDMIPLAEAAGLSPTVHKWLPDERAELMADLDAAFFFLYGMTRDEVESILATFSGMTAGPATLPVFSSRATRILNAFDRLAESASGLQSRT